jgi:Fe-S-cluster containining protein
MTEEERQKTCIACQACCKKLHIPINPILLTDPEMVNLWTTRGLYVRFLGVTPVISIDNICPHLHEDGCDIYANRPKSCRDYDGRKDPFLKDYCKLED